MVSTFELLEPRNLLAADVEVVHDAMESAEVGAEVTQTIRIYADEAADVQIRSLLTPTFENPTWKRFDGYGKEVRPLFDRVDADFSIVGADNGRGIGDFNGDGIEDFLFDLITRESVVLYGGVTADVDFANPNFELDQFGPEIQSASAIRPIGDVNGDGFDDLGAVLFDGDQFNLSIIFGSSAIDDEVVQVSNSPSPFTATITDAAVLTSVGDLNADGFDDVLFGQRKDKNFFGFTNLDPTYVLFGHSGLGPNESLTFGELMESGKTTGPLGSVRQAESIGDFNNDGFDDAMLVLRSGDPIVLYGGDGSELQRVSLDGFNTINAGLVTNGAFFVEAYRFAGAGDLNGDHIADIAFSFNGGDCGCGASGRPSGPGGIVVIYGDEPNEPGQVFRPDMSQNTNIRIDGVSGFLQIRADVIDVDGDTLADLHMLDFPGWPDARRNIVILGDRELPDIDFGHAMDIHSDFGWNGNDQFDGESVFGFTDVVSFLDFNGDGTQDVLTESQVLLGKGRGSRLNRTGTGDIGELVQIDANRSVIYEVTGALKSDAVPISTTAVATDLHDESLRDNIEAHREGVLLHLDISVPRTILNEVEVDLIITNSGPANARDLEMIETISSSLDGVEWEKAVQPFPAEVSLGQLESGLGTALTGPDTYLFDIIEGELTEDQIDRFFGRPMYAGLGRNVGSHGDLNADGFDDIFVGWAERETDKLEYLQFYGSEDFTSGGFSSPVVAVDPPETQMTHGDFNGDGFDDSILVDTDAINGRGAVHVLYGMADETLPEPAALDGTNGFTILGETNGWVDRAVGVFGDVNGDGFDDVILPYDSISLQGKILVLYGGVKARQNHFELKDLDGQEGFQIRAGYDADLVVASDFDINGDGIDDLLIGDRYAGSSTFGGWPHGAAYMILGRPMEVKRGTGAINELLDVPVGSEIVYTIRGTRIAGTKLAGRAQIKVSPNQLDLQAAVKQVAVPSVELRDSLQRLGDETTGDGDFADLDGDGDLDLFVTVDGGSNQVWFNDGTGVFTNSEQSLGSGPHIYSALGDVDADGDIDAVVAKYNAANELWLNDGSGFFTAAHQQLGDAIAASIDLALADLDADGDLDLFVANTNNTANRVLLNDGTGRFSDSGRAYGNEASKSVELVDVNGDGDLDAVVANQDSASIVWWNNGKGIFHRQSEIQTSGEHITAGDIDADGDPDLIVAHAQANEIWLNDGSGQFSKSVQELVDGLSSHVALADFDTDGDLDIFFANWEHEANRIWVNDGSGVFSDSGEFFDFELMSEHIAIGDVDGDGDMDVHVAVRNGPSRIYINDAAPLPGDIDRNGSVNFADFLIFSHNFGREDADRSDGDLDDDGRVTFADFLILSNRFGQK